MDDGLQILMTLVKGLARAGHWLWTALEVLEGLSYLAFAVVLLLHGTARLLVPCLTLGYVSTVPVFAPRYLHTAVGGHPGDTGLVLGRGWASVAGAAFWIAALTLLILRA